MIRLKEYAKKINGGINIIKQEEYYGVDFLSFKFCEC